MFIKGKTGITDMLGLPSLEDALKEQGMDVNAAPVENPPADQLAVTIEKLQALGKQVALSEGTEHTEAMDELYKEILTHARDLMAYGYNIDSPRARGIFEVASTMYNHAMTAANLKRESQLKTMKLALERQRVELEEKRTNHGIGQQAATIDSNNTIVVEDRNELIRRLREQMKTTG